MRGKGNSSVPFKAGSRKSTEGSRRVRTGARARRVNARKIKPTEKMIAAFQRAGNFNIKRNGGHHV